MFLPNHRLNAPDEERALARLLNPVDGPGGRTPARLFKACAPHPGRWAADRRPIEKLTGRRACAPIPCSGLLANYFTLTNVKFPLEPLVDTHLPFIVFPSGERVI